MRRRDGPLPHRPFPHFKMGDLGPGPKSPIFPGAPQALLAFLKLMPLRISFTASAMSTGEYLLEVYMRTPFLKL